MQVKVKEQRNEFSPKFWTYRTDVYKHEEDNHFGEIDLVANGFAEDTDRTTYRVWTFGIYRGTFKTFEQAEQYVKEHIQEFGSFYDGLQVKYINA